MIRLHGRVVSGGAALGTAAVVRWVGGIAQLPPRLLEEMALVARRGLAEPIDIVLIVEELSRATGLTIPGVRVVGVVAEADRDDGGASCPALVGVEMATDRIADDLLVILDAERGMALVDPDGMTVAAYQSERERIAPRRRFYIDYAHEPARTADGRLIRVLGVTASPEAISTAAESGADGIVFIAGPASLDPSEPDEAHREFYLRIFRMAGGKPIALVADPAELAVGALLEAATVAEVTLALPMGQSCDGLRLFREHLAEAGRELSQADKDWASVRIAAVASPEMDARCDEHDLDTARLLADLSSVWEPLAAENVEWLDDLVERAAQRMIAVEIILPAGSLDAMGTFIAVGVSAVGVSPDEIQPAKELIRNVDAGAIRSTQLAT